MALRGHSNASSSQPHHTVPVEDTSQQRFFELEYHLRFGNLTRALHIIDLEPRLLTRRLPELQRTPLMMAVKFGLDHNFIQKLVVSHMWKDDLNVKDSDGNTVLHMVARGDPELSDSHYFIQVAWVIIKANNELLNIKNNEGRLPIQLATDKNHGDMSSFLFFVMQAYSGWGPYIDPANATLVQFAVAAELYGLAEHLLQQNKRLAIVGVEEKVHSLIFNSTQWRPRRQTSESQLVESVKLLAQEKNELELVKLMKDWVMKGLMEEKKELALAGLVKNLVEQKNELALSELAKNLMEKENELALVELTKILGLNKNELAHEHKDVSLLEILAEKPSTFRHGMDFEIWESLIYHCAPDLTTSPVKFSIRDLCRSPRTVHIQLYRLLWMALEKIVKPMKRIRKSKSKHLDAIRLTSTLCYKMMSSCADGGQGIFMEPFFLAAKNGIHEIVEEILNWSPDAIDFTDDEKHSVFHIAVMYRQKKIFKTMVSKASEQDKNMMKLSLLVDAKKNNLLHLAAYQPPQDQFGLSHGTALQMQQELWWYKEVEKLVQPQLRKSKNEAGKIPWTVFKDEHGEFAQREIQRITGIANSCTVAASVIATVSFAAAITVPGGNDNDKNGLPFFLGKKAFLVFFISDSLALLASLTALLAFLSIFNSRYTFHDIVDALPRKLIMGSVSLFISVVCLIVTFGCTLLLVAAQNNLGLFVPMIVLAAIPVAVFAPMQFQLVWSSIKSIFFGGSLRDI